MSNSATYSQSNIIYTAYDGTSGSFQGAGGVSAASIAGQFYFPLYDNNGQQKSAKPKAETRGGRDFEAVRMRGVRSGIRRRNYYERLMNESHWEFLGGGNAPEANND